LNPNYPNHVKPHHAQRQTLQVDGGDEQLLAELLVLQTEYAAWCDALPDSLRDSATADALQEIVDLDLDALASIQPPRGYGRD